MQDTGIGYRAPGTGYLIPDTQYLTRSDAEDPTPSTEDRAWGPGNGKRAHRVCTMQDRKGPDLGYLVPGTWYLAPGTRYQAPVFEKRAHRVCIPRVRVSRGQVPGIGYRLSGTWDLVPGTGAKSTPKTGHRAPRTEPGHRKTRTPGIRVSSVAIRQCGNTGNRAVSYTRYPSLVTRHSITSSLRHFVTSSLRHFYAVLGVRAPAPQNRGPGADSRVPTCTWVPTLPVR
jgi:hypothetical protein